MKDLEREKRIQGKLMETSLHPGPFNAN